MSLSLVRRRYFNRWYRPGIEFRRCGHSVRQILEQIQAEIVTLIEHETLFPAGLPEP